MADNYLEKHYNDYQSRKTAWQKRKTLLRIRQQLNKLRHEDQTPETKATAQTPKSD